MVEGQSYAYVDGAYSCSEVIGLDEEPFCGSAFRPSNHVSRGFLHAIVGSGTTLGNGSLRPCGLTVTSGDGLAVQERTGSLGYLLNDKRA